MQHGPKQALQRGLAPLLGLEFLIHRGENLGDALLLRKRGEGEKQILKNWYVHTLLQATTF